MDSKNCKVCGDLKPLTEFHYCRSTKDKKRNECIDCYRQYQDEYRKSEAGVFKLLLMSAKNGARLRKERGRLEAGVCDITEKDIRDQYYKQNGLCYYSGIKMNLEKRDWKISIERVDTNKGYIKDNIVLCCFELNSKCQWSSERIREMIHLIDNQSDEVVDIDFYTIPKRRAMKRIAHANIDGIDYYSCTSCDDVFSADEFNLRSIRDGCTKCRESRSKKYLGSPRGVILNIISGCKSNLKQKKQDRNLEFDLDFDFMVSVFKQQNGKCAYSGLPLCFGHDYKETFWKLSIERIDPLKGYLKDNVCLICLPFNGTDHTSVVKDKTLGSGAWNKEKFQYFIEHVRAKYN